MKRIHILIAVVLMLTILSGFAYATDYHAVLVGINDYRYWNDFGTLEYTDEDVVDMRTARRF